MESVFRTALWILVVCLLAGGALADDPNPGHAEPKNLTASCGTTQADLSWDAVNDANVTGYDVYRKAAGESQYTKDNGDPVTGTTYTVSGLASSTSYSFGVVARYSDGHQSVMSDPATCTTG